MPGLRFIALVLTALTLVPEGAHLFALANKIAMPRDDYFAVQGIYRGWALFGIVLFGALAADLVLAFANWRRGHRYGLPLFAGMAIAATLVIFFLWTYPANVETTNWIRQPDNWETLRRQWEYSHAVNAVISFGAFCALAWSLARSPR